jgi:DNA-directed RNA polymerase specialized sigma24 family protein
MTDPDKGARLMVHRAFHKAPFCLAEWWHMNQDDYVSPAIPVDPHKAVTDRWPETPRLVYRLHNVEGLGIKEIAGVMAIRPARVQRALARAQKMLAERVA